MRSYNEEVNVYDKEFKSMGNMINLTQEEQKYVLEQVNKRINRKSPINKLFSFRWSYVIAVTAASLFFLLLALPQISNVVHNSLGSNQIEKNKTPIQTVQKYYESLNQKNFEAHYNLQSKRLEETQSQQTGMTKEDFKNAWKQGLVPAKVLSITVKKGGTEKGTIVSAKVQYPLTINSPAYTQVETFKLIKEDGEWKIDEVLSYERTN